MTENRSSVGVLKTLNILPYSSEQMLTPTQAPTAMSTGSPQASWTFQKSIMAPYFSGNANVVSYKPHLGIGLGGQNTSGVTVQVYMQINKNGSTYKSSNVSVPNNNYFCASMGEGPNDGDIYDIYIWSSATSGLNCTYQCCWCAPTHVDTGAKYLLNYTSTALSLVDNVALFPLVNSSTKRMNASWTGAIFFHFSTANNVNVSSNINGSTNPVTVPLYVSHPIYKLYHLQGMDAGLYGISTDSTFYKMNNNNYIYSLSYREITVGK